MGRLRPGEVAAAAPRAALDLAAPGAGAERATPAARGRSPARLGRVTLLLVLLIGCAFGLRLLWLDADPATDLTFSGAPFTDEGLYSHVARQQALGGALPADGWDNRLVSPLWDRLADAVFSLLGTGFVQLRLISIVLTTATLPLFFSMLARDIGARAALAATLLWTAGYAWFQYSRLGLLEPGMVALLVAAAWCWRNSLRPEAVYNASRHGRKAGSALAWALGAGLLAGCAVVWKSLALLWTPVPLLALALLPGGLTRRVASGYASGLGLALLAYGLLWYLPHRAAVDAYNVFYASDRVPAAGAALRTIWSNLRSREIAGMAPALVLAAVPGGLYALWAARSRALPPTPALCLVWTICGLGMLALPYSPSRYWTLILPPLCGLAGYGLAAARARSSPAMRSVVVLLVLAALLSDGYRHAAWATRRERTLLDGARRLAQIVPPGDLVLGVAACGLSPGNALPCAPPFAGLANDDRPVERLGARYAVAEIGSRDDYLRRFYPELLARSRLAARLRVGPREYGVYELSTKNQEPRTKNQANQANQAN